MVSAAGSPGRLVIFEGRRIETAETAIPALIRQYQDSSTLLIRSDLSDQRRTNRVQHDFVFGCRRLFWSVTAISGEGSGI